MQFRAYVFSAILHTVIIALLLWDFSFGMKDYEKSSVPVIMIDLQKVQIGELTNLPPKVKKQTPQKPKKEVKAEPKKQPQKQKTTVKKQTPKPTPKPEPVKPKEQPKPKESVQAVEPPKKETKPVKKEKKKTPKTEPKQAQKAEPVKEQPKKKKSDGLKSLLASVEDMKKNAKPSNTVQEPQETGQEVQDGIEGGTEGSLMQPLTISEKDLIANKLRSCWNVDAGLSGIENMIVEVRAYVNRDGSIRDVKILNMRSDTAFRSVAESARRAIYICENREDSPFKMLAEKRGDSYQGWKEIFVRFNPLDGGVY